jgi:hypothetical protein
MEIKQREVEAIAKKRRAILDKVTCLEKGIKILDHERFMWTQTKHNYDKHVKQWRIGRILLQKKIRLLKQGLFLCFLWGGKHRCLM